MTVDSSTFTNNRSAYGGAISNIATGGQPATFLGTALTLNGNAARFGGGVFNQDEGGGAVFTLAQSLLTANSAQYGGGVFNNANGEAATLTLRQGTRISGNTATVDGGGVFNRFGGSVVVRGGLISGNVPDDCVAC